jgi:hypothetical protein
VTPVLNIQVQRHIQLQRPAALSAARAQVSELLPYAIPSTAHEHVGYSAVAFGVVNGRTQAPQFTWVQGTSVPAANVFGVKQRVIDMDPVGGVRGKPPRGRPV